MALSEAQGRNIEKRYSEGGAPRRYTNDVEVKIEEADARKSIKLEGSNFSAFVESAGA
jgi:hypothetical protein